MRTSIQAVVALALTAQSASARGDAPGPLEISIASGYARGLGPPGGQMPGLEHLAGDGGALRLEGGWRIDPRWMVGCYHEASLFGAGHAGADGTLSVAAGLQGQLHLLPFSTLDPWIGVGFGWRGLWLDHGAGVHAMQGFDLARLQVGADYRVSSRLSIAPTVGVTFTEMLSEKLPGASAYSDLPDRKISAFVFAGLSGRMDVLGGA